MSALPADADIATSFKPLADDVANASAGFITEVR
jgi:hypothetical protein